MGEGEQKRERAHLKIHLHKPLAPLDQKRRAHVQVELAEPLLLRHIRVPHADRAPDAHLAHQQAVHPAEAELHELHPLALQMLRQRTVDPRGQVLQPADLPHDPRLREDVVVLDAV